jgi:nicotinamidase-related amidase
MRGFISFACALTGILAASVKRRQGYVGSGIGYFDAEPRVGNGINYWRLLSNGTYDLTRSELAEVTSPRTIPCTGPRQSALIEPSRSVLVIIDMQNYFLHPALAPQSEDGRAAVEPTIKLVEAFRDNEIKVTWVNWGLGNFDLLYLPPSVKAGASPSLRANETIGGEMGDYEYDNSTITAGPRLTAGSWNVEPYGALKEVVEAGVAAGTDWLIPKNRLSALWGAQTLLETFLQQHEITTIFIGGVDADQCVRSTFMDAYFKGEFVHEDANNY